MTGVARIAFRLRPNRMLAAALLALAAACGTLPPQRSTPAEPADGAPGRPIDVASIADAVPRAEPPSRYGNPTSYVVFNQRYDVLASSTGYVERGIASWYGTKFHGRRTSSGDPYDMYAMTAAHKTLPIPTYAEVTNLTNGRRVIVKINDRGPFKENRLIDLSYAAATKLGIAREGTGLVEVRAIDPANYAGATPPADPPDVAPSRPGLYLQVGAFSQEENAARLRSRLDGRVPNGVRVVRTEIGRQPLYRVRIGPLAGVEEADRVSRDLLALGLDTHVVVD
jgi:rare lipoprotein A